MRRARNISSGKASALADIAARKASGLGRVADYQLEEADAIYDEVDEATYAEISALKRRDARAFVVRPGEASDVEDDDHNDNEDEFIDDELEDEFALEDEMSVMASAGVHVNGKRKRTSAPNPHRASRSRASAAGTAGSKMPHQRVASAFLNNARNEKTAFSAMNFANGDASSAAEKMRIGNSKSDFPAKPVIDKSMLDADFDAHLKARQSARRKKKAALSKVAGDMLFDAAPAFGNEPPTNVDEHSNEMHVINDKDLMPPPSKSTPHLQTETPSALKAISNEEAYNAPPPSSKSAVVAAATAAAAKETNDNALKARDNGMPQTQSDELSDAVMLAAAEAASQAIKAKEYALARPVSHSVPRLPPMGGARSAMPINAPLARESNGDLVMFWTDAQEMRINGAEYLYLFGKAPVGRTDSGVFASVCVQVQGMERALYILPRKTKVDAKGKPTDEPVKLVPDVYKEVTGRLLGKSERDSGTLAGGRAGSSNLPSAVKAKIVTRACPFGDEEAPREPTQYLKVKIPYNKVNKLTVDSNGTTFKRVYGAKTSASEHFCLKRRFKGPGWIRVCDASPHKARLSHARHTLFVADPDKISVDEEHANRDAPPLSMLCINAKTMLSPKTGAHELVMISGVFVKNVPLSGPIPDGSFSGDGPGASKDFTLVRAPDGMNIPFGFRERSNSLLGGGGIEVVPNEAALLNNFLTKLLRLDPDVLVGHDLMGFGLDVLVSRLHARRSRDWSRLGRLVQRRDLGQVLKGNTSSNWFKEEAVSGRLVIDTLQTCKELLFREKDFSLTALSHNVLAKSVPAGPRRQEEIKAITVEPSVDVSMVPKAFQDLKHLLYLVEECSKEARTAGRLAANLNVLPLTRQLTAISGNLWSRTLRGARAERIEYLLCHELRLIGSKKGGKEASAGNVSTKLLLPDKLTKFERNKLKEQIERRKTLEECEALDNQDVKTYGFGGPSQADSAQTSGQKAKSARRKPQYAGGLVLEPKKGLYDRYVLQLDFNSLYPSIIQEFNICFTTLDFSKPIGPGNSLGNPPSAKDSPGIAANSEIVPDAQNDVLMAPGRSVLEGVLPRVLRRLVEQRRQVKNELRQERERNGETLRAKQLDTRQLAIKLTANSLYGCLGFEGSRFFARPLAQLITLQGRETLQKTVDLARDQFNAEVIYGDTDSVFVNTGLDDIRAVRKVGTELKREVNKKYRTLEIEIDAIYAKMLLLKKKKYAAMKLVDPTRPEMLVREVKGLDLVRHDWCDLSHDASEHFLSQIFQSKAANVDDAVANVITFLSNLARQVQTNQVLLSKYVITRALTKKPEEYPDGRNLPHVQVALRLRDKLKRRIQAGDYIKYVICQPQTEPGKAASDNIADRAFHPDEVQKAGGDLVIDVKYYLENQVLPPILRLCDPIESIDGGRIAQSLGIDGRKYERKHFDSENSHLDKLALGPAASEAEKYSDVDPLMVSCGNCGASSEFKGLIFKPNGKAVSNNGLICGKCNHRYSDSRLANCISLHVRTWLEKYYCTPYTINGDDGQRSRSTRNIVLGGNALRAKRQYDEAWLYTQFRYLYFLMDIEGRWSRLSENGDSDIPVSDVDKKSYEELLYRVDRVFHTNAFRFVDIAEFLAPLGLA